MNNKFHIITIGCQMNKSDSERIAGYLEKFKYKQTGNKDKADIVILTTCGVRQAAENRAYSFVSQIKKDNIDATVVLTGCLANRDDVKKRLKGKVDIWMPITELNLLASKLREKNSKLCIDSYLNVKPKYDSGISVCVPIGNGCDNFCSYCVVPYARGREVYRDANEIIDEVKYLVDSGVKEIELIAQNVNSYISKTNIITHLKEGEKYKNKSDIDFAILLEIIDGMPGDFWIRFTTSHPKDMSEKVVKVISKSKKICEHIHLPVQSGDNDILQRMNRKYSVEQYKDLIKTFRKNIKNVSITTDLIVGFPGETEEQFKNSAKLFEEVEFDMAYISQYSPRPQTAAYELKDDVSKEDKKRWEDELVSILSRTALKNNQKYLNEIVEVLVVGKNKKGEYIGKTRTNKIVKIINSKKDIVGNFVKVKIKEVRDFGMKARVIK